jgi:acylphosphatase
VVDGAVDGVGDGGDTVRVTAWLSGRVHGVGLRWWVRARALELGLAGHAANLADGRVEVVAEGTAKACTTLLRLLSEEPSTQRRPGHVTGVNHRLSEPRGLPPGFVER